MAIDSWEWDQHKSTIKCYLQNELGVFVAACHDYLSDTIIQEVRVEFIKYPRDPQGGLAGNQAI